MDMTTLRRTGAFLGSAALLASLTVATVAAPASAGQCEPFTGSFPADGCYYATGPITGYPDVPAGVTLNGSDADDVVGYVDGTFNGGAGNDYADFVGTAGTFNGGPGDDGVGPDGLSGTFNGGPGDDSADYIGRIGTFNGGSGDDCVYGSSSTTLYGTFAGGGGSDWYNGTPDPVAIVWSAEQDDSKDCPA